MKKIYTIFMVAIITLALVACSNVITKDTLIGDKMISTISEAKPPREDVESTLSDMTEIIVPLTENELAYFNGDDFFNGEYLNIRNQFLSSLYSSPEKIDLFQLFYCGSGLDGNTNYVTEAEMDTILSEYMGLTLAETEKLGLDNVTYLEKEAAYDFDHGDTNYRPLVAFSSGEREGDIIRLFYDDAYMGEGNKVLTLRESDGTYLFISHQKV